MDQSRADGLAEEKRVLYVALTRARDRLILTGVLRKAARVPDSFRGIFRKASASGSAEAKAVIEHLLAVRPYPISWLAYTLPDLPAEDGRVHDLPLRVRWIEPKVRVEAPPVPNRIREVETALKQGKPVPIPGSPDRLQGDARDRKESGIEGAAAGGARDRSAGDAPAREAAGAPHRSASDTPRRQAEDALEQAMKPPPLPSPGLLPSARGKIWATEFKSGIDREGMVETDALAEGSPDEPAESLISRDALKEATPAEAGASTAARDATGRFPDPSVAALAARDAAAQEGTLIHAALERIDLKGLTRENLPARAAEAGAAAGGLSENSSHVLIHGLERLLSHEIAPMLTTTAEFHREVAFSLRIPLLEITRWLPDLRAEILESEDWMDWVEEDGTGALRIKSGKPAAAGDPWVLVQGRIDAVVRDEDGWIVIDWKSDRVSEGESLDRRAESYRGQMEIYRRAVGALFGSPVRALLYFLRPGIMKEVS
jgi:ATP-dependent exoDNAse (exonuclease V) beta subunit